MKNSIILQNFDMEIIILKTTKWKLREKIPSKNIINPMLNLLQNCLLNDRKISYSVVI